MNRIQKLTNGGKQLEQIKIELRSNDDQITTVYVNVDDSSLSRKWIAALVDVLKEQKHLEKNYCFMGFVNHERNGPYILDQVNQSIDAINSAEIGYRINDYFSMENCITDEPDGNRRVGRNIIHDRFNELHRYFEDLQGVSGAMSPFYQKADPATRWHIRQLNLLCHEFESWAMSYRKQIEAPEWMRPSQLMCWLHAPRFTLDEQDYELFGIDTINRKLGGVYIGVNKAVGKHHWEVFNDEGRDSRIDELTTTTLKSQTEAAADFDIEWARDPGEFEWQKQLLSEFRDWLTDNGFDPEDKSLTIGHPRVGQVDLIKSFGTEDYQLIWQHLETSLDVAAVEVAGIRAEYPYRHNDSDYQQLQISTISREI